MIGVLEPPPAGGRFGAEGPPDQALVAAVRRGDDRAFETLYSRYHRRIHAYVLGMCKDHARAEDVTQEVFVSALRRMRETERPIAFKPWIYEIAKNACIDVFRRSRRAEEVSLEAQDALAPADLGRLAAGGPSPEAAVDAKQALDQLCGAFGGLSDVHHEILVMRELEGLSYREIGERLGMSRPAVESTLFRARRRLTEEYDELVSGQRCLRVQRIIATATEGRLGARDTRRLARHVAHCQPCRREALAAGLDAAALRRPVRTRVAEKVAGLLPFPGLARRLGGRGGGDAMGSMPASGGGGPLPAWLAQMPALSDQLGAGWGKAIAAAAVLLAGIGAGVGTKSALGGGDAGNGATRAPAHVASSPSHARASAGHAARGGTAAHRTTLTAGTHAPRKASRDTAGAHAKRRPAAGGGSASSPATGGGGAPAGQGGSSGGSAPTHSGGGGGGSNPVDRVTRTVGSGSTGGGTSPAPAIQQLAAPVTDTVTSAGSAIQQQVAAPVQAVTAPVQQVTAPVQQVTKPIQDAAAPVTQAVQPVVKGAGDAVGSLVAPPTG
jgi:RNA polymerase sigma factor (sigma-70 family)